MAFHTPIPGNAKRVDPTFREALATAEAQGLRFPRLHERHQHDTRVAYAQIASAFAPRAGGK